MNDLTLLLHRIDSSSQQVILLLNKVDVLSQNDINKIVSDINNIVTSFDLKANIILLSAKQKIGIEALKKQMSQRQKDLVSDGDATLVTNLRHYEALKNASSALADVHTSLLASTPTDLVAEDLRRAIASINLILGSDLGLSPETLLHNIFQKHCIGK